MPAYAPELNPVEYLFGYAKQRELANLCLDTIDEVRQQLISAGLPQFKVEQVDELHLVAWGAV